MPRIAYETWRPSGASLDQIEIANDICQTYAADGYDLTLRQLYYRFVAAGHIPNNMRSYKNLGNVINKGRMAGLIDWNHIVDRTRNLRSLSHWSTPGNIIDSAARSYALDKWSDQDVRVEVWVEKDALAGVVQRPAERWDIPFFSCRGYVSQSELWGAARRHLRYIKSGQRVHVIHLGDHDPSGIDMTRDIAERLHGFLDVDWVSVYRDHYFDLDEDEPVDLYDLREHMSERLGGYDAITVERIALNMPQVEQYDPPPNPAKLTDSRAESYIENYGTESWELDALPPDVLDALIEAAIVRVVDEDRFQAVRDDEEQQREILLATSRRWDEVREFLQTT